MNSKQPRPSVTRPGARSAVRGSGAAPGPKRPARPVRGAAPSGPARPARPTNFGAREPITDRITMLLKSRQAQRRPSGGSQDNLSGIRMNLQTLVILGMVVIGLLTLYPQAQIWFEQRQQIADLQKQVADSKANLAKMKVDLNRWSDPVYIRSQARDRLYYVLPGEVSYLVMGADGISNSDMSGTVGAKLAQQRASTTISATVTTAKKNWVNSILQSVVRAGLDEPVANGSTTSVGK